MKTMVHLLCSLEDPLLKLIPSNIFGGSMTDAEFAAFEDGLDKVTKDPKGKTVDEFVRECENGPLNCPRATKARMVRMKWNRKGVPKCLWTPKYTSMFGKVNGEFKRLSFRRIPPLHDPDDINLIYDELEYAFLFDNRNRERPLLGLKIGYVWQPASVPNDTAALISSSDEDGPDGDE
jgi:hypothetical protein